MTNDSDNNKSKPKPLDSKLDLSGLKSWQLYATTAIFNTIVVASNRPRDLTKKSILLVAPTRTGKTFGSCKAIAEAQRLSYIGKNYPIDKYGEDYRLAKILFITPKSVQYQFTRVAKQLGVKDFLVTSYSSLRATLGEIFIDWVKGYELGNLAERPFWNDENRPDIIVCDEAQNLKNSNSQAATIIRAAIEQGILVIFMSATPAVTIDEMRIICIGLGITTNNNWRTFSYGFCGSSAGPTEISPANMARLTSYLEETNTITRYENITYVHKVFNKCIITPFQDKETSDKYQQAYNDLLQELRKVRKDEPQGVARIWAMIRVFRMRAEYLRVSILGNEAVRHANEGKQVIIGSNYVETLIKLWDYLTKTKLISSKEIVHLTGSVPMMERQRAIDRFQHNKVTYFLTTIKAGGVGLSLHHEYPDALPRVVLLPPTYSGPEMAQVLGRAHGPTSLSTTKQFIIWYKDTIEESVAQRAASRFKCIGELYSKKTTFLDVFENIATEDIKRLEEEFAFKESQGSSINEDGESIADTVDINMFALAESEVVVASTEILKIK